MSRPWDAPDPTLNDSDIILSASALTIATGDSATFTATVSADTTGGTPTGSVVFYDGSTLLDEVSLSAGVAVLTTTALLGTVSHSISAFYPGSSTFNGVTSAAIIISPASTSGGSGGGGGSSLIATTLALSLSATTALSGAPITLASSLTTASVGAAAPTGSILIYDGGTVIATLPLVGGAGASATITFAGTASHALTALYSGDSLYAASSSTVVVVSTSEPSVVTFLPWLTKLPEFTFDRGLQTMTGDCAIQNVSGDTVRRDSATIFSKDELTGALFIFRIWKADCEYDLMTVVGNVKDPKIAADGESMTCTLQGMYHWSDIQAPRMEIGVGCDWSFGSMACGSTSTTPCNNDYGSCSSPERFTGTLQEWVGAEVTSEQTVQPEPLRLYNPRRSS